MRAAVKFVLVLFVVAFLGMQFASIAATPRIPVQSGGAHMAELIDPRVGAILDRSCQDCHSNRTNWPWYSHVAPVSWLVSKDVEQGREMLDLSTWADHPHSEGDRMYLCNAVSTGSMPLASYAMIHRHAKLSKQDVKLICDWAVAASIPGN
jgi:hypothetical protein